MNSVVRTVLAVVVGYAVFIGVALLLGARPDGIGDWLELPIKGFFVVAAAVGTVTWLNRRKRERAARREADTGSEPGPA